MSERNNYRTRRKVIKSISAATVPLYATGTSMALQEDNSLELDTSFNPNDEEAVVEFLVGSFEKDNRIKLHANPESGTDDNLGPHSSDEKSVKEVIKSGKNTRVDLHSNVPDNTKKQIDEEGKRILDELSHQQLNALKECWNDKVELKVNSKVEELPTDSGKDTVRLHSTEYRQAEFEEEVTGEIVISVDTNIGRDIIGANYLTYNAFTYTHNINWEHIPGEEVNNPTSNCIGSGGYFNYARWHYRGDEDQDIQIRADGNFFISDSTGVFDRCTIMKTGSGWTCLYTDRLYTRAAGNWNGTGALVREEIYPST